MTDSNCTTDCLEIAAKVLLRCAGLGFLFLLIWFGAYSLLPGTIHQQGAMFGLTEHDVGVIHYSGMAMLKISVFVLFLFPYVAIRLVLRKRRG